MEMRRNFSHCKWVYLSLPSGSGSDERNDLTFETLNYRISAILENGTLKKI